MSGSYSDISGPGAVEAAKMAVEDFGGTMFGVPIEVVVADHQNKADIGLAKAREWYEVGGVDAIFEMIASSVTIAVFEMTKEKKKIAIASGAAVFFEEFSTDVQVLVPSVRSPRNRTCQSKEVIGGSSTAVDCTPERIRKVSIRLGVSLKSSAKRSRPMEKRGAE
jgi:Periplasmic binding protein